MVIFSVREEWYSSLKFIPVSTFFHLTCCYCLLHFNKESESNLNLSLDRKFQNVCSVNAAFFQATNDHVYRTQTYPAKLLADLRLRLLIYRTFCFQLILWNSFVVHDITCTVHVTAFFLLLLLNRYSLGYLEADKIHYRMKQNAMYWKEENIHVVRPFM